MLRLPENWPKLSPTRLAKTLMAQVPETRLHVDFLAYFLAASLPLAEPSRLAAIRSQYPPKQAFKRMAREFLETYNKIVRETHADERLLIEIPYRFGYRTMRVCVPTYDPDCDDEYDYKRPASVTIEENDGLRIVMGDPEDVYAPDVMIERAVDLWRVFVHPDSGDEMCIIEIRKDCATIETERGDLLHTVDLSYHLGGVSSGAGEPQPVPPVEDTA